MSKMAETVNKANHRITLQNTDARRKFLKQWQKPDSQSFVQIIKFGSKSSNEHNTFKKSISLVKSREILIDNLRKSKSENNIALDSLDYSSLNLTCAETDKKPYQTISIKNSASFANTVYPSLNLSKLNKLNHSNDCQTQMNIETELSFEGTKMVNIIDYESNRLRSSFCKPKMLSTLNGDVNLLPKYSSNPRQMTAHAGNRRLSTDSNNSCDSDFDENVDIKNLPYTESRWDSFENLYLRYGFDTKEFENQADDDRLCSKMIYRRELVKSLNNLKIIKYPSISELNKLAVFLPPRKSYQKKILIFDLDHTLVHSHSLANKIAQNTIKTSFKAKGKEIKFQFSLRPYALECLKEASKYFQIGIFTASKKEYADSILDKIDPMKELIQFRLYVNNCYVCPKNWMIIKDLRIIQNAELQDIVIIDNSVQSFGFQLDNGIPILSYYSNPNDEEFHHLIPYLKQLAEAEDVRPLIRKAFKVHRIYSHFG